MIVIETIYKKKTHHKLNKNKKVNTIFSITLQFQDVVSILLLFGMFTPRKVRIYNCYYDEGILQYV